MSPSFRRLCLLSATIIGVAFGCGESNAPAPVVRFSPEARALVDSIYLQEFRAMERYDQVLRTFGGVAPFRDLLPHKVDRLQTLRDVYAIYPGITVPDPYAALHLQERFADIEGACRVSASFEQRIADRYERALTFNLPAPIVVRLRANHAASHAVDLPRTLACQ